MKHGFLILTHHHPGKVLAQVQRLQAPGHYFIIHFDRKQDIDTSDKSYRDLEATPNVTILANRVNVQWGSVRMLDATIELMKEGLKISGTGYMHLLSGECGPAKSNKYIDAFFEQHKGKEFINHFLMPRESSEHGFTYKRIDKYHLYNFFDFKSKKAQDVILRHTNDMFRRLQRVLKVMGIYRRYSSSLPVLYAGSQWWSLSYDACKYCIDFMAQHPEFYQRIKYAQIPDEFFFQTLIMNSPFKDNVVNDNLRYIDFIGATSHPNALTMKYVNELAKENILFARKFTAESKELLAYLEKNVF